MIKILLIEDDLVDRMAIWRMVKQHPETFDLLHTADSLASAMSLLEKLPVDLIISDYHLGDGSALELLENYRHIPIILITGISDEESIRRFKQAGAAEVLVKDNQLKYIRSLPALIEDTFRPSNAGERSEGSHHSGHPDSSRQSGSPSDPVDLTYLSLTFDGNKDLIRDMIRTFLDQNPIELDRLSEAMNKNELSLVALIAHKVKSGYKLMGMQQLQDQAESIEDGINKKISDPNELRDRITQLINGSRLAYRVLTEQLRLLGDH